MNPQPQMGKRASDSHSLIIIDSPIIINNQSANRRSMGGLVISKRLAFGTIIIMIALILVWAGLRYIGGEKTSVGEEANFYSRDFKAKDTLVVFIRNDDAPLYVYVTDAKNADKAMSIKPFEHYQFHDLEPYERSEIIFTIPEDGEYGLLITPNSDLYRSTYWIQFREPIEYGHFKYSIYVPIIFIIIIILVSLIYSSYGND